MKLASILTGALIVAAATACAASNVGFDFDDGYAANVVAGFSAIKEQYNVHIATKAITAVFVNGGNDPDAANAAVDRYFHPDYVNHNPNAPNGREATRGFAIAPTRDPSFVYEIGPVFAEGDYVAVLFRSGSSFSAGVQIGMDLHRIRDGVIIEHWDVMTPEVLANETASGNAMFPLENPPTKSGPNEESNRIAVTQLLNRMYNRVDITALEELFAEDLINHAPAFANGRADWVSFVESLDPELVDYRIGWAAAYGDFVVVHSRLDSGNGDVTINANIFRLEDGIVVENWDHRQTETSPQDTNSGNTMFPMY